MTAKRSKEDLLELYEATGDETAFREALPLFELAVANGATPEDLVHYGYLLESHARNQMREAVAQYERAIELDPEFDKARYQLIGARAGLREPETEIALYEKRLADSPGDIRQYRFAANAYLAGSMFAKALEAAKHGLSLWPDDAILLFCRADARAGLGDTEGALTDYGLALASDPEHIGPLYMKAFLLERIGRRQEAIDTWQAIFEWNDSRDYELDTIWPKKELERLRSGRSAS